MTAIEADPECVGLIDHESVLDEVESHLAWPFEKSFSTLAWATVIPIAALKGNPFESLWEHQYDIWHKVIPHEGEVNDDGHFELNANGELQCMTSKQALSVAFVLTPSPTTSPGQHELAVSVYFQGISVRGFAFPHFERSGSRVITTAQGSWEIKRIGLPSQPLTPLSESAPENLLGKNERNASVDHQRPPLPEPTSEDLLLWKNKTDALWDHRRTRPSKRMAEDYLLERVNFNDGRLGWVILDKSDRLAEMSQNAIIWFVWKEDADFECCYPRNQGDQVVACSLSQAASFAAKQRVPRVFICLSYLPPNSNPNSCARLDGLFFNEDRSISTGHFFNTGWTRIYRL